MTLKQYREELQLTLHNAGFYHGKIDGDIGPLTLKAVQDLAIAEDEDAPTPDGWEKVKATIFANPSDIAAFKKCNARGNSDNSCFKVGDNGIGAWHDDTTVDKPYCALPPEKWEHLGSAARGAIVEVCNIATGETIECELRDTMPHIENITNGAGIDLNPCAFNTLGFKNGEGKAFWRFKP